MTLLHESVEWEEREIDSGLLAGSHFRQSSANSRSYLKKINSFVNCKKCDLESRPRSTSTNQNVPKTGSRANHIMMIFRNLKIFKFHLKNAKIVSYRVFALIYGSWSRVDDWQMLLDVLGRSFNESFIMRFWVLQRWNWKPRMIAQLNYWNRNEIWIFSKKTLIDPG